MAKIESTKMTVSLDNDSKRILRNLTKAVDRLARNMMPFKVEDGVARLMEPADELALNDDNENHSQEEKPKHAKGGFVGVRYTEPSGSIDPKFGPRVDLDFRTINEFQARTKT